VVSCDAACAPKNKNAAAPVIDLQIGSDCTPSTRSGRATAINKEENQNNHEQQTQAARRVIAQPPACRIGPRRECADQQQKQDDYQYQTKHKRPAFGLVLTRYQKCEAAKYEGALT
jgi:hypothetical protein